MPGITNYAFSGLAELAERGITPTPDEIVRLNDLARRVEDPVAGDRLALLGCPVKCGNAILFRLTIAASLWWKELACNWWTGNDVYLTASLAFAMAHGRTPGALPLDRDTARVAVGTWYKSLTVNRAQLDAAIMESLTDESDDRADEIIELSRRLITLAGGGRLAKLEEILQPVIETRLPERNTPVDWEEIAHELSLSTGTAPDYWLHESRQLVLRAWIRAKRLEMAKPGLGAQEDTGNQERAIKAFRAELVAIMEAHKQQPQETPTP